MKQIINNLKYHKIANSSEKADGIKITVKTIKYFPFIVF